jgi:ergothioneine biosynthesis protein EgtB
VGAARGKDICARARFQVGFAGERTRLDRRTVIPARTHLLESRGDETHVEIKAHPAKGAMEQKENAGGAMIGQSHAAADTAVDPRGNGSKKNVAFESVVGVRSPSGERSDGSEDLERFYREVRSFTELLVSPLTSEDAVIQSMPEASPTKWHLAHTSWFFETFVLAQAVPGFRPYRPQFSYLFNSYYNAVGPRHCRPRRGLLSRPSLAEVRRYRRCVDEQILQLFDRRDAALEQVASILLLGLHHEQQHQELILTDIKHVFWSNPLRPSYSESRAHWASDGVPPLTWVHVPGGLVTVGDTGDAFAFDNERPAHRAYLEPFALASRPVTNGEYRAFMEDGGYERPELWLSDGWTAVNTHGWRAPLYWERRDDAWWSLTLAGMREVEELEPVCHVSYYEADAYARWAGARLPSEEEWETAAAAAPIAGSFVESGALHPVPITRDENEPLLRLFGDVWEWTRSAYSAYPGYRALEGALGEYNGKFMCNQLVLRGGSCATPASHIRRTYRNFFVPETRWQFSGIRLAKDVRP